MGMVKGLRSEKPCLVCRVDIIMLKIVFRMRRPDSSDSKRMRKKRITWVQCSTDCSKSFFNFVLVTISSLTVTNGGGSYSYTEEMVFYTFDNNKTWNKSRETRLIILKKVYFHQYKSCNIETLIAHNT